MKQLLLTILFITFVLPLTAQSAGEMVTRPPKYEVRAAWVTAVYGLDWPRTRATSPEGIRKQKAELVEILDRLKDANFNTVLFQTRTRGDVLYRSKIEPFNSILTGKTAADPGYDPLAFAIEECHKRGMECHAWMVAIPLGNRKHVANLGNASVTKQKSAICVPYKREYFLNPGNPATKEYLMSLVREVVEKYDVDGVHFDYLRYPENAPRFPDTYDFRKYGKGRDLAQWRRDNITEIVRHLYKGVKALKPWVKVSTCPVGNTVIPLVIPPADGMLFILFTKMHKVGWVKAYRIRYIPCFTSGVTISILLLSTGRNKVMVARSFPDWVSISSIPVKETGHWMKWSVRCTSSVPTNWQVRPIIV